MPKPPIDNLGAVLPLLDGRFQDVVLECRDYIEELVLDLGCKLQVKWDDTYRVYDHTVTRKHLDDIEKRIEGFRADWRGSLPACLHRVAAIYEYGTLAKVTIRFARLVVGLAEPLRPYLLEGNRPRSVLIVGVAGVGKSSLLRDLARIVADLIGPYLIVIDGANEVGGDGLVPHPCLGNARRFRVEDPEAQHLILQRALESHNPKVLMFDELSRRAAVERMAEAVKKGAAPVATVHGKDLLEVVENEANWPALGLSLVDGQIRRIKRPVFEAAVLIVRRGHYRVFPHLASAIDGLLAGNPLPGVEVRNASSVDPTVAAV